jgi:hypothetical protein
MLVAVPTMLWLWMQRRRPERVSALALLLLFCAGSIASILYRPDSIHIALIAPFFIVLVAVLLEWALQLLPESVDRTLGAAAGAAVLLCGSLALYEQMMVQGVWSPVRYQSAFGEVALDSDMLATVWKQLRPLIDADPSHLVHFYPIDGYSYLLSGAKNPTRFGLIIQGRYTPPEQVREILHDLDRKRVRYVIAPPGVTRDTSPIAAFIREHYQPATAPYPLSRFLWVRKDTPADAPGDRANGA